LGWNGGQKKDFMANISFHNVKVSCKLGTNRKSGNSSKITKTVTQNRLAQRRKAQHLYPMIRMAIPGQVIPMEFVLPEWQDPKFGKWEIYITQVDFLVLILQFL